MCNLPDKAMVFTATGTVRRVDSCMRSLVQFLNDLGVETFDCCCGHGRRWGHVTVGAEDAERVRGMGFRVCLDTGVSRPAYPFAGDVDGHINIILPPVVLEEAATAA